MGAVSPLSQHSPKQRDFIPSPQNGGRAALNPTRASDELWSLTAEPTAISVGVHGALH